MRSAKPFRPRTAQLKHLSNCFVHGSNQRKLWGPSRARGAAVDPGLAPVNSGRAPLRPWPIQRLCYPLFCSDVVQANSGDLSTPREKPSSRHSDATLAHGPSAGRPRQAGGLEQVAR